MNSTYFSHLLILLKKLSVAFLIFTLCRILFYIFNSHHFSDISLSLFIYGIRFDAISIAYLFSPLIILQLLPIPFKNSKGYLLTLSFLFYLGNSIGIILNLVDLAYFDFTFKRSTTDFFSMIGADGGEDFMKILPHYVIDYWYDYVILIVLVYLSYFLHNKIIKKRIPKFIFQLKDYAIHSLILIVFLGLTVIAMRGGLQYRPIDIVNAGQYAKTKNIPIVLNTPFTIIKTLFDEKLKPIHYFTEEELKTIYTPVTSLKGNNILKGRNVVLIILESFAKEYVGGFNNGKGYTPFIDSLLKESYSFTNAYSNGLRSIQALPSILSGLPPLSNSNFVGSLYAGNKLDALPNQLKNVGYNTSFYHGAANGTMRFNGFTSSIGIDHYYGLNEYPEELKETDHDGFWGIFDEPYMQYYAHELNQKPTPFFSTIFSISSHHPYTIPKKYINKFPKGTLPLHETVGYTDYSLKQFFNTAKKMDWFKNTLFVFTADHSAYSNSPIYNNNLNLYAIPVFFYDPSGKIKGVHNDYFQQTDISPTILDLVGVNDTIISFGNNAFNEDEKFVINFISDTYQISMGDYFLQFSNNETIGFYYIATDSLLQENLITKLISMPKHLKAKEHLEQKLKAIIQQYNNRLINNNLSYEGE